MVNIMSKKRSNKPQLMDKKKQNFLYSDNYFRYYVVPIVFVVFFTSVVQYLALVGQGQAWDSSLAWQNALADLTAWKWTLVFLSWAILWLRLPFKVAYGPETSFGYKPPYRDNGVAYYWVTLITFLLLQAYYPQTSSTLYSIFPRVLGVLNIVALTLCLWLLVKGKVCREHVGDVVKPSPLVYEFYRGMELHPRVLGVDVKQFTNSRIGMMTWQIFLCAFYLVGVERHGFNMACLVYLLVHSVYIARFFWWETGYFSTIDMMMDRGGYYLCWGCLCWMPVFFSLPISYSIVSPPTLSPWLAVLFGLLGLTFTLLTYKADSEKSLLRSSPGYKCMIWGKPAKYILAEYTDGKGVVKQSPLLTSGFWGVARHLNYTFELGSTVAFCAALGFDHAWNWLYLVFIGVILLHRTLRDEEKCRNKYGPYWTRYCKQVPYVLIPRVW